jgi:hypothetical protein
VLGFNQQLAEQAKAADVQSSAAKPVAEKLSIGTVDLSMIDLYG